MILKGALNLDLFLACISQLDDTTHFLEKRKRIYCQSWIDVFSEPSNTFATSLSSEICIA